jgi:sulfofructose kinase
MNNIQVVGLGMSTLDILIRISELPTWEDGSRFSAMAIDGGGPVATAIAAVARLGVRAGFVGTCGNDRLAEIKLQTLTECGIDVSRMARRPAPENEIVLVSVHEQTGERLFTGSRAFQEYQLAPEELDRDYFVAADVLHLDGYHADAALLAADWMRAAGKIVVLDGSATRRPILPKMQALVSRVDVLICGSGFGAMLTGRSDPWEIGRAILDIGPSVVIQTEGKAGSYSVTRDDAFHVPSFDIDVVDTTGAGDVFHGAYIVGMLRGWDVRRSVHFATAVSALKCTGLGGRRPIPCFDQVIEFLRARGIEPS